MDNKKGLFKNIMSFGGLQIANFVFPLISIPIVCRILGPDKFGVINYAATFIAYFNLIIGFGFDFTATRRVAIDPQNINLRSKVFSEVFWSQCLLFTLSVFIFFVCLQIVPPLALEKRVAIFSFLFCIASVFTQNWLFQAMQDLPKIAIVNLIGKVVFTIFILIVIKQKKDYFLYPLILGVVQILMGMMSFYWAFKRYKLKLLKVRLAAIISLLMSERLIFFSMVVISLYTTTNVIILGLFKNSQAVGYYTAAQKLIDVASSVLNIPLSQAFYPFIGMAFGESMQKGLRYVQRVFPLIVLFSALLGVTMFVFGPFALRLFYGKAFDQSISIFRIMAFIPFIISLSNIFGIHIMMNLKMDKPFFYITAGGAVFGVVFNILMIKIGGYTGTAINWLVVEICITLSTYIFLRIKGINPVDLKRFKISSICAELKPLSGYFLRFRE